MFAKNIFIAYGIFWIHAIGVEAAANDWLELLPMGAEAAKGPSQTTPEFEHDLESVAVQIKTDSAVGSEDGFKLMMETEDNKFAGFMRISFSSPMHYFILHCGDPREFPDNLPTEKDKVWTIAKTSEPRITIKCNGVEVVNHMFTDCGEYDNWDKYWKQDVAKIQIKSLKAVDGYRAFAAVTCSKPEIVGGIFSPNTDTIEKGAFYTISCELGYTISGMGTAFCQEDGQLTALPTCDVVTCTKPEIANATLGPETATINSTDTYTVTCDEGFTISGSPTVTCQSDGNLSELPTCQPDDSEEDHIEEDHQEEDHQRDYSDGFLNKTSVAVLIIGLLSTLVM